MFDAWDDTTNVQVPRAISTNTINLIACDAGAVAEELPVEIDDYAFV